jgi:SAM-dependent methyltransferase
MARRERLISGLDLGRMRGVEIGPLISPIVSKEESEVFYVDHADRETLQAKYANDPNVDIQKIVPVDAVWGDRTLRECFADNCRFDYVIASHVLEHVPDMLGWMREIADILRPGGRLILAIPDRRFTFDYLRQTTRLSEVIDAYLRRNRRPMPAQIFDFNANAVEIDMIAAWENRINPASLKHYANLRYALDRSIESVRDGKYVDGHCWVFTPSSLAAILADLVDLDLLPYKCLHLHEPERNTNEIVLILERLQENFISEKEQARSSFTSYLRHAGPEPWAVEQELELTKQALQLAETEVTALRNSVHALEADITALLSSRSFRITRPLRKLRALARSLLAPH